MTMVDSRRYWLMALGEESRHWDSCYAAGIAFIGWDDEGDLRQYLNKDQLRMRGLGMHDALACWEFCHVMKPGDTIFVKKEARLVLGHGVVRSPPTRRPVPGRFGRQAARAPGEPAGVPRRS